MTFYKFPIINEITLVQISLTLATKRSESMNNIFPLKHTFTGKYMITYGRVPTWILHTEQIHEKEFNFISIE